MYALLHHPEYREHYEADLKKMLPHIPKVEGFAHYADVGRKLAHLHVNYEQVEPWESVQEEDSLHAPEDAWQRYQIGAKMHFLELDSKKIDYTRLEYNEYVTLVGIPEQAQRYTISGRSPLGWVIYCYWVEKNYLGSGITKDPNAFLREQGRPDAVVDLIKRLVTVSMRTQELLATLPPLEIPEGK